METVISETGTRSDANGSGIPRGPGNIPPLGTLGIKADQLFADPIKDPDKRMARLEQVVVDMRREMDDNMPAIRRLVSIEGDLQELVHQLQGLMAQTSTVPASGEIAPESTVLPLSQSDSADVQAEDVLPPPPPATASTGTESSTGTGSSTGPSSSATSAHPEAKAPSPDVAVPGTAMPSGSGPVSTLSPESTLATQTTQTAPPAPTAQTAQTPQTPRTVQTGTPPAPSPASAPPPAPSSASASGKILLNNVRIGNHADKARIVIDSSAPLTISDDLDPVEKLLVLDIDGADVDTASQDNATGNLISTVSIRGTGPKMGQAVFELKKATKVQRIATLPPSADNPNYRTIIDMER